MNFNLNMTGGPELSEKIPDEIFQLVESFRKFIREQKAYRDQKYDVDTILEVDREADEFMLAFQRVSVDSDTNSQLIQQIRNDTTKLLRHAELAYSLLRPYIANNLATHQPQSQQQQQQQQQHSQQQPNLLGSTFLGNSFGGTSSLGQTNASLFNPTNTATSNNQIFNTNNNQSNLYQTADSNTYLSTGFKSLNKTNLDMSQLNQTTGIQFANTTSSQYFSELAEQFELRMRAYGEQIKELKMSLDSVIKTYNADELFKWLKKQHETLGEIAAKVYMTHERIMEKKSELDRSSNIFAANNPTKSNNLTST